MDSSSQKHFLKPVFPQWPPSEAQSWPHVLEAERTQALGRVEASAYVSNGIALASLRSRICSDAVYGDVFHPPASRSQPSASSLSSQDALTPGQQHVWQEIDKILEKRHAEARSRKPEKPKVAKADAPPSTTTRSKPGDDISTQESHVETRSEKPEKPKVANTDTTLSTSTSSKPEDEASAKVAKEPGIERTSQRQETVDGDDGTKPGDKAAAQLASVTDDPAPRPVLGEVNEDTVPKAAPKPVRKLRSQKRVAQNKFYAQIETKKAAPEAEQPQVDEATADNSSWGAISGLFGLTSSSHTQSEEKPKPPSSSQTQSEEKPTSPDEPTDANGGWGLAKNVGGLLFGGRDDTGLNREEKKDEVAKEEMDEKPSEGGSSTVTAAKKDVEQNDEADDVVAQEEKPRQTVEEKAVDKPRASAEETAAHEQTKDAIEQSVAEGYDFDGTWMNESTGSKYEVSGQFVRFLDMDDMFDFQRAGRECFVTVGSQVMEGAINAMDQIEFTEGAVWSRDSDDNF